MTPIVIDFVDVYLNGMCAVFDLDGEQIPQYQGYWIEKCKEIEEWILANPEAHVTIYRNVDY